MINNKHGGSPKLEPWSTPSAINYLNWSIEDVEWCKVIAKFVIIKFFVKGILSINVDKRTIK